jgi:hypothetical protein
LDILVKLDKNKAYGIDGIPTVVYKLCAMSLYKSLTLLFNISLHLGSIPDDWKTAAICPILKLGTSNNIMNYRPISLLPIAVKVMEKCVHNYIYPTIQTTLNNNQHGFRNSKSTITQLISFYDQVHLNLDNNIQTDIIYLDLAKAFDSVPHKLLIAKLQYYGFNGKLLFWLTEYLHNRKQCVMINGTTSDVIDVLSGVPQGSILGPLLFIIYIDDMITSISANSNIYLYADDSKVCRSINHVNDCVTLQRDLNLLYSWSLTWGLNFNINKCQVMTVTRSRNPTLYEYVLNDIKLLRTSSCKDLGLIISDKLHWDLHISESIKKANKRLGLIKRILGFNVNTEVKLMAYITLVRPLLEYGSIIWSQATRNNVIRLEAFQRRATKYICNNYSIGYSQRLYMCRILPLSYRRELMDITFYYNCKNHIVDLDIDTIVPVEFVSNNNNAPYVTRSVVNDFDLPRRYPKTELYKNFFSCRIVSLWNTIPAALRNIKLSDRGTNTSFKNQLKKYYLEKSYTDFVSENPCTWLTDCRCSNCRLV